MGDATRREVLIAVGAATGGALLGAFLAGCSGGTDTSGATVPSTPGDPDGPAGPPTLTSLSPRSAYRLSGTPVELLGSGLSGATAVTFGGVPSPRVTPIDDGRVVAVQPLQDFFGTLIVVAITPRGPSNSLDFTYT